jgi:hypothetical protein
MESVLHTMYVVAIKDTGAWQGDSAADLSIIGFWNLVVVWLKVGNPSHVQLPWYFDMPVKLNLIAASDPVAILPTLGFARRDGST